MTCELSVSPEEDPALAQATILRIQRELNASGRLRATPAVHLGRAEDPEHEMKSDPSLLYTLSLAFITSGAAKALIETVRAVLSSRGKKATVIALKIGGEEIPISNPHLSDEEARELIENIETRIVAHGRTTTRSTHREL